MNLDQYQKWTRTTAIYRDVTYPRLALAEEVGEFLGKIAKHCRDGGLARPLIEDLEKEAGDIMWQLARVLDDYGISMQECLNMNVEKLESRKARNKLSGSGDDR